MDSIDTTTKTSPIVYARIGGILYLIIIVVGIFSELFVRDKLIVSGDALATANNIMASEMLWRIGAAGGIAMLVCAVVLALILYILLKPVNKYIALLAVFFNLVSISIEAFIKLYLFEVLLLLGDASYLAGMPKNELYSLAYQSVVLHSSGYNISLVFFGINCFFWGYLIVKSNFLPKILGVLLILCCVCYLVNSFTWFIAPSVAKVLFPVILIPCFIAELSLCLWLIVKGVNMTNWNELNAKRAY